MLIDDFLETEDKNVKIIVAALTCMKQLQFHTMLEDIVTAAHGSTHELQLYSTLGGVDYEIFINAISKDGISVRVNDPTSPSSDNAIICLNDTRVLTLKSKHIDSYSILEWLMIVGKSKIITNDDMVIPRSHLVENRFQYDTVNPLAGLILDFWKE